MTTRLSKDMQTLLQVAKLDSTNLETLAHSLYFSHAFCGDNVALLELDPLVLAALKDGQSLVIKGRESDLAVCCSSDRTFEMKESETSNSLLLFSNSLIVSDGLNGLIKHDVECLKRGYYELKPVRPCVKQLKEKLETCTYDGSESTDTHLCTFEEFLDMVPCSEKELLNALKNLGTCYIKGYWRLLNFEYLYFLLQNFLAITDDAGWPYQNIPYQHIINLLKEICTSEVADYILEHFTSSSEIGFCQLHEKNICRLYAEMILKTTKKFDLEDFKETWQLAIPDGLKTNLDQIRDLAIIDWDSKPEAIRYFPASSLPEEIQNRFQALFAAKEKWTLEDIAPYLQDLSRDPQDVTKLLMKYSRMSTVRGIKAYSSRSA